MNKLERIKFGKTKPLGLLKEKMDFNLEYGYVGNMDELLPELTINDDIFGKDRRNTQTENIELGLRNTAETLSSEYMWWNSESQGNWMDGFVRTALISDIDKMTQKAECKLKHYIDTIDQDGYIGIYTANSRYRQGFEGGELWAQSTILRTLTAYYEKTSNKEILSMIISAVNLTMEKYPIYISRPFSCENEPEGTSCGGLSHGLTITDTLYFLFKETGDKKYIDYAVWLYDSCSAEPVFHSDIPLKNMMDDDYRLKYHGVHTYEHIRALALARFFGNKEEYVKGYNNYLKKVEPCLCPSGGPTGNEWINGHYADSTEYGYEYCSIHELMHSWCMLLELTGDMNFADKAECIFYNAGFGAHHPTESSITYLKTDNCYELKSAFKGNQATPDGYVHYGYKYSPTHQDMAVCCVPNAARMFPYFVSYMWQKTETGFIKSLYGSSVLEENFDSVNVKIIEESNYPYSGELKFKIETSEEKNFSISFRIPNWCKNFTVSEKCRTDENVITIEKTWSNDEVTINLDFATDAHHDLLGDTYFTNGPLTMALPIESEEKIVKNHPLKSFYDKEYLPVNDNFKSLAFKDNCKIISTQGENICVELINEVTSVKCVYQLVPIGKTILRKVTF